MSGIISVLERIAIALERIADAAESEYSERELEQLNIPKRVLKKGERFAA